MLLLFVEWWWRWRTCLTVTRGCGREASSWTDATSCRWAIIAGVWWLYCPVLCPTPCQIFDHILECHHVLPFLEPTENVLLGSAPKIPISQPFLGQFVIHKLLLFIYSSGLFQTSLLILLNTQTHYNTTRIHVASHSIRNQAYKIF